MVTEVTTFRGLGAVNYSKMAKNTVHAPAKGASGVELSSGDVVMIPGMGWFCILKVAVCRSSSLVGSG
jgi:hypothetical protein